MPGQLAIQYKEKKPRIRTAPHFAEFFAGIGLMRFGLEAAGWKVAWANDIDATKCELYDAHFGDAAEHFVLDDVHNVDASTIPTVELVTASFPCTDLSLAGGRRGIHAGESSAFWGFRDVLAKMNPKPKLVLLENVTGFLSSCGGRDFEQAMRSLNALGYGVDPFVLNARWFVPQSRPRLFVVGTLDSSSIINNTLVESRIRPRAVVQFISDHPDIKWNISSLPEPPNESECELCDIVEDIPLTASEWWSEDRVKYLYDQMSERHRDQVEEFIRKRRYTYGTVFRRVRVQPDGGKKSMAEVRLDGIAGCLRTPKGGSGRQILIRAGHGKLKARLLTPRECARLMGADDFELSGSLNEALFGFGDAVCAPAVEWIAKNYLANSLR